MRMPRSRWKVVRVLDEVQPATSRKGVVASAHQVPDVVVDLEIDGRYAIKISSETWEVNVRVTPQDIAELTTVRGAAWPARDSIALGEAAGGGTFWSSEGDIVTVLIGHDDETWDVAVSFPISVVDEILQLVSRDASA